MRKDRPRVLVTEDEPRLRGVLQRMLKELGYPNDAVGSGEQAIKLMDEIEEKQEEPFGIAILDLQLPGMDGLAAGQALRKRTPGIQLVVLTGFGDIEAAQRAIRVEAADFLTKPASLGDLEAALDRAWERLGEREPEVSDEALAEPDKEAPDHPRSLEEIQRDAIVESLARHDGNRKAVAEELGIALRTLYYRIRQYQEDGHLPKDD